MFIALELKGVRRRMSPSRWRNPCIQNKTL